MRILLTVCALLSLLASLPIMANELSDYEQTCKELGFKPRTASYGECVLEFRRRDRNGSPQASVREVQGDGTPDHQTCNKFGFVAGTPQYSECRLKIDIAKREAHDRQAAFEVQQARFRVEQQQYEARLAEYEKEKNRREGDALMRFGAALASGRSPYFSENLANAGRISLGMPPVAPMQYQQQFNNFTITGPSGRMINCTAMLNNINCF